MKTFSLRNPALCVALGALLGSPAYAAKTVSWEDIVNDDKTTGDVLTYGLGMKAQRHSPLKQINTKTVSALTPAWSYSFGGEKQRGQQGQALVHDGVIYITGSYSRMYAVEAKTGKRLWTYSDTRIVLMYWNEARKTVLADILPDELIEIDPQNGVLMGPAQGLF